MTYQCSKVRLYYNKRYNYDNSVPKWILDCYFKNEEVSKGPHKTILCNAVYFLNFEIFCTDSDIINDEDKGFLVFLNCSVSISESQNSTVSVKKNDITTSP